MGIQLRREKHRNGTKTSEAQVRLQKLENIVTGLMQNPQKLAAQYRDQSSGGNATVDQRLKNLSVQDSSESTVRGHLDYYGSETDYRGATHWATILENVFPQNCHIFAPFLTYFF